MRVRNLAQCALLRVGNVDPQPGKRGRELARGVEIDGGEVFRDLSGQALLVRSRAIPQRGPSGDVDGHAGLLKPDDGRDGGELESGNLSESFVVQPGLESGMQ